MMTQEAIEKMLNQMQVPYRYFLFEEREAVAPPFMVWYLPGSDNFAADGRVYFRIDKMNLELYTDQKDFSLEEKVEHVFSEAGLYWNKTESFLDEEQMYEVLYEMEV